MVKSMHAAGIEVILDVVYNHTAEGNHLGPTLSFKGIDNQAYYRLVEDDLKYYMDYTGTGNSLNVRHPHSLQLIMDSLRYWVTEMHVDGFRFDLASTLAREFYEVDRLSTFFELVQQDPVVSQVKLIAEPWDVGPGGYQVGNFPPQWTEWNGAYRDTVRDFWRGEPALGEFASRISGSSDLYENSGRRPFASINFVTAHDGFTMLDLVSYNEKHNEANGEDNNDGESHNRSWNHGIEGPTDDPAVRGLRAREQRNLLATLLLSQGVPMVLHGDELGRTQHGNNNTYAQDSEISWVHWDQVDTPLVEFTSALIRLRREHPTFQRKRFFTGTAVRSGEKLDDIVWLHPDGRTMENGDWDGDGKTLGMYLNGHGIAGRDARGEPIIDDHFLLFFNVGDTLAADAAAGGVRREVGPDHRHRRGGRQRTQLCRRGQLRAAVPLGRRAPRAPRARGRARPLGGRIARRPRKEPEREPPVTAGDPRRPASTYRLQITADFDLFEAARRLPYLHDLGVDWVYLSPLLEAEPGSTHGYDVVAFDRVDASRGGAEGLAACRPRRVGWAWACSSTSCPTTSAWQLRPRTRGGGTSSSTGAGSEHAEAFDIDWEFGHGKVRLPGARRRRSRDAIEDSTATSAPLPRAPLPDGSRHEHPDRAALRAGQLAPRRLRPELPALLHGHHPGRRTRGGAGGLRRHARRGPPLVRRGPRRRPAHRPPRRPARPGGVPRPPRQPDLRRLHAHREDPRDRRGAALEAGRWTAPRGTTCSRCSTACSPTRRASSR